MAQAAVVTELKGENSNLKSALNESEQMTLGFGKVFAGVFSGILAANFFGKIKDAIGSAFQGVVDEERSIARLESVVKATGGAAGFTADQLSQMADNLERLTGIDADVIRGAEGIIATFKNVRGDVFKEATVLAADMAEVLGTDLKGAAMQVAKALNDPERGITALSRAGVSFSESQKAMIQSLMETGNVAGAQRVILEELKGEFGGAAEAAGKTLGGQIEILKRRLEGASETVVKGLLPAIEAIKPIIDGALTAFENVAPAIGNTIAWVVDLGRAVFKELQPAFDWIRDTAIERFTALQVHVETMWGVVKDVFALMGSTVGDAMSTVLQWLKSAEEGITSLIINGVLMAQTAIEEWRTVWELSVKSAALALTRWSEDAVHIFGTVIPESLKWFADNFVRILADIGRFQMTIFSNIGQNVADFAVSIKDAISGKGWHFDPTDLLAGFKTTFDEFPKIAARTKTDTERLLEEEIDAAASRLGNTFDQKRQQFEDRVKANRRALDELFQKQEKESKEIKDRASHEFEKPTPDVKKEKVEKEVKTKETKETKEKVDRQVKERRIGGEMEALESLAERIGAAAAGTPDATLRDVQGAVDDVEDAVDGVRDAIAGLPAGIAAAMPKPAAGAAGGGAPGPVVPPKGGGKVGPGGLPLDLPAGAEEERERQDERARRDRRIREAHSKIANRPFEEEQQPEDQKERIRQGQERAREQQEQRKKAFADAMADSRRRTEEAEEARRERMAENEERQREAERNFPEPVNFEPPEFVEPAGAPANDRELAMLDQLETMVSQLGSLDRIAALLENLRESNETLRNIDSNIPKISMGLS